MASCLTASHVELTRRSLGRLFASAVFGLTMIGSARAQSAGPTRNSDLAMVRHILQRPESDIDLANAKLTIDRMMDPSIDVAGTLMRLDAMARELRSMLPAGASRRLIMDALRYHLYKVSSWNDNRPFQYDLDDPFGANSRSKLLTTYLGTRKGNCVSMPLLFIILGQKLGIDVTAAMAPNHVFVKYRDDDGKLYNLETTSGAGFARDAWMRQQFPMTDAALASGIYMRPLTKKETVVVMVDTLLEFYGERGLNERRIAMAKLALEYSPKDVSLLLHQHQAYRALHLQEFVNRYPTPNDIPMEKRPRFMELERNLRALYDRAYALGWRPLDQASEERYRQTVMRARAAQQP